jgi:hypothetical protein
MNDITKKVILCAVESDTTISDQERQAIVNICNGVQVDEKDEGPLLTPRQMCEQLKISYTTLWRMRPPYILVGARKRFDWAEVRRFLAAKQNGKKIKMRNGVKP